MQNDEGILPIVRTTDCSSAVSQWVVECGEQRDMALRKSSKTGDTELGEIN
jgi:hypothetical protein